MAEIQTHFGVYGVVIRKSQLLSVRKGRGPYKGWLDLPGGSPMPHETAEAALERELSEECGGLSLQTGPWKTFEILVQRNSAGEFIQFRHTGQWRSVQLAEIRYEMPAFEDVVGLEWIPLSDWRSRDDLSPPLRLVLEEVSRSAQDVDLSDRRCS